MENMEVVKKQFWKNRKVLITGHTGFKGSWLSMWISHLGAEVTGYSLLPSTELSLFNQCQIDNEVKSVFGDIRDLEKLNKTIREIRPEIIFHMAAQPLVRESYRNPVETYSTNVMGTVNLLEAIRNTTTVKALVNITSDKCYQNNEWVWGYRENDPLGGYDPYSSSKACSELVTSSFVNSYFSPTDYEKHGLAIATARAGNVIGGGDWSPERLVPDLIKSLLSGEKVFIRNPDAIRPWQHVLDAISGYLNLAQKLYTHGPNYGGAWNFGPDDSNIKSVKWIVKNILGRFDSSEFVISQKESMHEAQILKLDISKAKSRLGWNPIWNINQTIEMVVQWTQAYLDNENIKQLCLEQIKNYSDSEGLLYAK